MSVNQELEVNSQLPVIKTVSQVRGFTNRKELALNTLRVTIVIVRILRDTDVAQDQIRRIELYYPQDVVLRVSTGSNVQGVCVGEWYVCLVQSNGVEGSLCVRVRSIVVGGMLWLKKQ